jgi:hypothetical protein
MFPLQLFFYLIDIIFGWSTSAYPATFTPSHASQFWVGSKATAVPIAPTDSADTLIKILPM